MRITLISFLAALFFLAGCKRGGITEEKIEAVNYSPVEFNEFIFVGKNNRYTSLFKYNLHTKEINEFWSGEKERVVEFSYSPGRRSAFFITAGSIGKEVLPHLNKAKLYVINNDSLISFVEEAGDGIQIQARWETSNAFKVFIHKLEFTNPAKVIQTMRIYNTYGKLFEEEIRSFNLVQEGYPQPDQPEIQLQSPGKKYSISVKHDKQDSVFFHYNKSGLSTLITTTDFQIEKVEWSPDQLFAAINLVENSETGRGRSELILYSIKEKKVIQKWKRGARAKYFIINDILVTDTEINENPAVVLYSLDKMEPADTIKTKGGAALGNLL
jgi:hypothetical protein